MNIRSAFLILAVAACISSSGCRSPKDITRQAQVQGSSVLGQRLCTTRQLELLKDKPSGTFRLVTSDYPSYPRNRRVGVVEAGTKLQVNKVAMVRELIAILVVLPEYYHWECVLARIEGGPYSGKEVAVSGKGLQLISSKDVATLGSSMLTVADPEDNKSLHSTPR